MCFFSIFPGHLLLNTKKIKKKKKIYLPTYPIFFGTVTGNKQFFFLGLNTKQEQQVLVKCIYVSDVQSYQDINALKMHSKISKGSLINLFMLKILFLYVSTMLLIVTVELRIILQKNERGLY